MQERQRINEMDKDKLFNFRPIFFVALFLCFGILYSYARLRFSLSGWWLCALIPIWILPCSFCRNLRKLAWTLVGVAVLTLSFAVGAFSFTTKVQSYASGERIEGEMTAVGVVVEKKEYEDFTTLVLSDVYLAEKSTKGKLIAYMPLSFCKNIHLADEVILQGFVRSSNELFTENGFNAYQIGKDIRFTMSNLSQCVKTGERFAPFLSIRTRMQQVVYAGCGEGEASVIFALLTGDVSGIESGLLENVRKGGVAHIFAVSGLHVGALYAFCLLLFKQKPFKKCPMTVKFFLTAFCLLFYAGVCGFTPSVVRATVICLVAYAAKCIGTERDFLQSLGFAAVCILLLSPTDLFEVGFQLSFAACLGIALLSRSFRLAMEWLLDKGKDVYCKIVGIQRDKKAEAWVKEDKPLSIGGRIVRAVISFLSLTLSAQVATMPILLRNFGYVSGWSLLLNCLFVPFIAAVFSWLLVFVAVACLLPIVCAPVLLYLPSTLCSATLLLFECADFSSFMLTGICLSRSAVLTYYGGWQFLSDKWNLSWKSRWWFAGLCFVAFAVILLANNLFV